MTPCLLSYLGATLGEGHNGEGRRGEGHHGDCRRLPFRRAAADPDPDPLCLQLPQRHAELALPGEVFAASQAPKTPAHWGDESPKFMVMGEAPGFVVMGRSLRLFALRYAHALSHRA